MLRYRILALDLDGTLLDGTSRVPPENARAVRLAQQRGVQVALCTGRNFADAAEFSRQLDAPADWAVTANGADVRRIADGVCVHAAGLDHARCETILEICARFGCDPCLYTSQSLYYGRSFLEFLQTIRARGGVSLDETAEGYHFIDGPVSWRSLLDRETEPFAKAILDHSDPQIIDRMTAALAETELFELAPSVMYGGQLKNVEVNRRGVHKGAGLRALTAHLGMDMDEVLAIGDSDNDLTMLQDVGLGVAMGNAAAHIRAAADAVTAANTENGVAKAIERYILEGTG